jgi:Na+/H+-dicarboxylate symporter
MNIKRILIATIIGLACGLFCASGTMMAKRGEATFPVTAGILASIVYNRVLIGFVIGIGDSIKLHSVWRGALIGAIITMAMSIISIVDGDIMGGLILIGFGIVYGIIADIVATKFSKIIEKGYSEDKDIKKMFEEIIIELVRSGAISREIFKDPEFQSLIRKSVGMAIYDMRSNKNCGIE